MRLLKRQKGLPFLLALGVLFVLSASFLAVQLWSDKQTMRGAVQALEAPVMPPAMPRVVAPPPVKKIAKASSAKSEVQPAETTEPAAAAVEPAPADINVAEVKIVTEASVDKTPEKKAAPAPVVEQAKPVVAPVAKTEKKPVAEKKSVTEKKAEKTVNVEKKAEKQPKSTKRAKKISKNVESVPTEIPAEWNWFSQPLKLSFNEGKAVIDRSENDKSISLSSEEKIRVESVTSADADVAVAEEKQPADAVVAAAEPSVEKPFMLALAKMARIRQMRHQNAVSEDKAVEVKAVELSPSMKAIGSMIRELCEKLDKNPETAADALSAVEKTEAVEVSVEKQAETAGQSSLESASVQAEAAVASDEKTETSTGDIELKPYYSGSGSSFSARIDSMLKQGLIKAE